MTLSRADIVLRAHQAGAGLSDHERAAIGATLIKTVMMPAHAPTVLRAAQLVREHGEALMAAQFDLSDSGDLPDHGKTTPHEQPGCPALPDDAPCSGASGTPTPRPRHSPRWRAAWDGFAHAMTALEDSEAGDFIGALALIFLVVCAMFALPLVFS